MKNLSCKMCCKSEKCRKTILSYTFKISYILFSVRHIVHISSILGYYYILQVLIADKRITILLEIKQIYVNHYFSLGT